MPPKHSGIIKEGEPGVPPREQRKQVLEEEAVARWELGHLQTISTPAFESIPASSQREAKYLLGGGGAPLDSGKGVSSLGAALAVGRLAGWVWTSGCLPLASVLACKYGWSPADPDLPGSLIGAEVQDGKNGDPNEGRHQGTAGLLQKLWLLSEMRGLCGISGDSRSWSTKVSGTKGYF